MKKPPPIRKASRAGFSMIEVLVAVAVVSMFVLMSLSTQDRGRTGNLLLRQQTRNFRILREATLGLGRAQTCLATLAGLNIKSTTNVAVPFALGALNVGAKQILRTPGNVGDGEEVVSLELRFVAGAPAAMDFYTNPTTPIAALSRMAWLHIDYSSPAGPSSPAMTRQTRMPLHMLFADGASGLIADGQLLYCSTEQAYANPFFPAETCPAGQYVYRIRSDGIDCQAPTTVVAPALCKKETIAMNSPNPTDADHFISRRSICRGATQNYTCGVVGFRQVHCEFTGGQWQARELSYMKDAVPPTYNLTVPCTNGLDIISCDNAVFGP